MKVLIFIIAFLSITSKVPNESLLKDLKFEPQCTANLKNVKLSAALSESFETGYLYAYIVGEYQRLTMTCEVSNLTMTCLFDGEPTVPEVDESLKFSLFNITSVQDGEEYLIYEPEQENEIAFYYDEEGNTFGQIEDQKINYNEQGPYYFIIPFVNDATKTKVELIIENINSTSILCLVDETDNTKLKCEVTQEMFVVPEGETNIFNITVSNSCDSDKSFTLEITGIQQKEEVTLEPIFRSSCPNFKPLHITLKVSGTYIESSPSVVIGQLEKNATVGNCIYDENQNLFECEEEIDLEGFNLEEEFNIVEIQDINGNVNFKFVETIAITYTENNFDLDEIQDYPEVIDLNVINNFTISLVNNLPENYLPEVTFDDKIIQCETDSSNQHQLICTLNEQDFKTLKNYTAKIKTPCNEEIVMFLVNVKPIKPAPTPQYIYVTDAILNNTCIDVNSSVQLKLEYKGMVPEKLTPKVIFKDDTDFIIEFGCDAMIPNSTNLICDKFVVLNSTEGIEESKRMLLSEIQDSTNKVIFSLPERVQNTGFNLKPEVNDIIGLASETDTGINYNDDNKKSFNVIFKKNITEVPVVRMNSTEITCVSEENILTCTPDKEKIKVGNYLVEIQNDCGDFSFNFELSVSGSTFRKFSMFALFFIVLFI